ncbi:MAG: (Fe-S)-binding protein [Deltaproteobacteria bacterium]|nr:(Fe-S)-binding protein [Candidatus Zymogenaceae bacterium]
MKATPAQAKNWRTEMTEGKYTPVLDNCITCFACNETCPNGANPCDQNLALHEKYRSLVPQHVVEAMEEDNLFAGEVKGVLQADRIMTTCSYEKSKPELIQGQLYDLPRVGGKPYLCWSIFPHLGAPSVQRKHLQSMVDRLGMTGAKEVVCFHVDCYSALARIAPDAGIDIPFRPVHLAEYLVEYLRQYGDGVKSLGLSIAYQRPCTSRYTPEAERYIDELFDLTGANRVKRAYDREKALCCTSVRLLYGKGNDRVDREKNVLDAKEAGAEAIVYLCPICKDMLTDVASEHSLPLIFLGDLARAALGEIRLPV